MIITVIGGGSRRTPRLIAALLERYDRMPVEAVVLHDIDADALDRVRALTDGMLIDHGRRFALRTTTALDEALDGAAYIMTGIRVGGDPSHAIDEQVPLAHGVVGHGAIGPGGWAAALRTIPVLQEVAVRRRALAPSAWILNFTDPVGLITQAITAAGERRVIGIGDAPEALAGRIAMRLAIPATEMRVEYVGLNHLGWIRAVWANNHDHLPDILASDDAIQDLYGAGLFDPAEIRRLGLLPSEGLHHYYAGGSASAPPESPAAPSTNGSHHRDVDDGFARAALSVIETMLHGGRRDLIVNTTNRGAVTDLDDGDVVEIPCRVTTGGLLPRSVGALPDAVADLVKRVKAYERATVAAAARRSWNEAVLALSRHPLVPSLDVAEEIAEDYRERHAPHLDYLR